MKDVCDILGSNPGPELRVVGNPRYDLVMNEATEFRQNDLEKLKDRDIRIIIGSCLLYTSPSPRDQRGSRMPSSA